MAAYTGELVDTPDVPVAEAEKTVAKTKAKSAPVAAAVPTPVVSAAPLAGDAVERVAQNVGKAATAAAPVVSNATQSSLDYARDAIANNPELTGALAAIPVMYGANKLGLFDTLGSKMSSTAQPQPMVGGSGPRNTPPTVSAAPIQDWGIHDEPPLFAPAAAPEVTAAPAAALSRNLTLEEAQARMAGVTPAATPETMPAKAAWAPPAAEVINKPSMLSSGTTIGTAPARPVTPTPPAALASTTAPEPVPPTGYNKRVTEAMAGVPKSVQDQLAKEGKVALKGYGAGDINLTNTYGMNAYQTLVDHFNDGKPIGSYDNYLEVNKKIQKGIPSSLAPEFAAKLPGSEAEAGNFGKAFGETGAYTKEGKIVTSPNAIKNAIKGGGAMILATAIPNLANAATNAAQGKYSEAGGQVAEVGMNFMPPALQALTYAKGAGEGEDTELARQRRMTEYLKRAGRGVAQGYDPRRLIGVAPPAR